MKHIIQFSGGAASSFVAKYVADKYGRENCILLFSDTKAECKDSYRFRKQVAEYIGMDITEVSDGRSLWELIYDKWMLPVRIGFCTEKLKIDPCQKFLKQFKNNEITVYYGYGMEEYRRIQKAILREEERGRMVNFPLYDLKISSDEVKRIIREDWKICLPESYKYLSHNNCIPCFKAGKGHFKAVARYYSEEFEKACKAEEEIGYTVFEDITLAQLREQGLSQLDLFSIEESIPCMCAV